MSAYKATKKGAKKRSNPMEGRCPKSKVQEIAHSGTHRGHNYYVGFSKRKKDWYRCVEGKPFPGGEVYMYLNLGPKDKRKAVEETEGYIDWFLEHRPDLGLPKNPKKKKKKKKATKNPTSQWTDVHRTLLTRMYQRPEIGPMTERGLYALMDLQNEGLATIGYISEEYQDPKAGPEEGEVLLWDVKAKITPAGKAFVAQSGMMQEAYRRQERAIRAMKAEKKGRTLKTPSKNPKKKAKKAAKKKTPQRKGQTALSLIANCQRKWESYRVKPSKKRLQIVFDHLEKMKASKAKSVKSERSRCLRVANLEAKRLKLK